MVRAAASEVESAALLLLSDNSLKKIQWDEALHLFQENDERNRTMRVRGGEVDEEGYLDEQVPVLHTRGMDMSSPSQMMQAHQQLQTQVMQLCSQQNEMAHQLRAVLDKFPQGHVARPISVPAIRPSHRDIMCLFCKHKGHFIRDCPGKSELNAIQSHTNSCDAEKHVNKLQEENDQLKDTLGKMKNTSIYDLNERENKWKREIHQLTFDLQKASRDAREFNVQLMSLKAKSPEVVTRIEWVEVESDTCKLSLEKCSTSLDQSRKETGCLRSQLTALGNKYQDVEQRLSKATEQAAHLQLVSRDHKELTERLRLLESESVERNDQLNNSDTVLPFGGPLSIDTTDDRVSSQTLTSHAVRRSIWANTPSHSNPAHFPMAG